MIDGIHGARWAEKGALVSDPPGPLVVVEPTYANQEHATVNGILIQALPRVAAFVATPLQHAAVRESDANAPAVPLDVIAVEPPGGITLRRMRKQWSVIEAAVSRHKAQTLVLLSAGPETLFVARALVTRHPSLQIIVIMHGNMADLVGWRSRDPRRRLIDLHSGMRIATHERIRLVVLEEHIRTAAARLLPRQRFLVWPHPAAHGEQAALETWTPGDRLRLTFVGTASRGKGFGEFLTLHQSVGSLYEWAIAGRLGAGYTKADVPDLQFFPGYQPRDIYLAEVRKADFAVLAYRPEYELTASGSLFDCVTQRKPIIAVANPLLQGLARQFGPIGHLCPDLDGLQALLAQPQVLREPLAYAGFQRSLGAVLDSRSFARLQQVIHHDLSHSV